MINKQALMEFIEQTWDHSALPELHRYLEIPCKSPLYDPDWQKHGYIDAAAELMATWAKTHAPSGMKLEVVRLPNHTPLIYIEVPGVGTETVLLYGHLDKQPEMVGWNEGLGPWTPVQTEDKLYGRGSVDDGYAFFGCLTAINALEQQGIPHARCVILIEASEESGSIDFPYYLEHLSTRIGTPSLIVCLDSGCGNYDQLWVTTSLRGMVSGELSVSLLTEGIHSGIASGIVADSFRVTRQLLSRIEDPATGKILLDAFIAHPIAEHRILEAEAAAVALSEAVYKQFPLHEGALPVSSSLKELVVNRTWRATLTVTGAGGFPLLKDAGNVLRSETALKLSLRLPPTCDALAAERALTEALTQDPPYCARVEYKSDGATASGWEAPRTEAWLQNTCHEASSTYFGKQAVYTGEGASIPFITIIGRRFPQAQFVITGLVGPHANAHGPNEFLHIPGVKKITACVATILAHHAHHDRVA